MRAARSGSSSCAAGTPKYAQIPSPWYACTMPPYSSTARLIIVTHSPTSTFASSGSSRSPSAVEPTMSAKRTVTGRRSSSIARGRRSPAPSSLAPLVRLGGDCGGGERRDGAERHVLAQDRLLEIAQLGVRLEPELLVEERSEHPVRLERVGLPARAVEGDHELRAEPLVERVEAGERLQLSDGLGLASDGEHRFEARLERLEPQSLEPRDLRLCERLGCEVGERRPAPERERTSERRLGLVERLRAKRGPTFRHELLELLGVESARRDAQDIARRLRRQRARPAVALFEKPPKLGDVDLHAVSGRGRRLVAPERVDEPVSRNDPVALEEQQREHAALLDPAERKHAIPRAHLERS